MINTQRLIDIRELYGFSREKLASKLAINEQKVIQFENGVIDPNFIAIRKLTELFSVSPDYFFNVSNIPHVAIEESLTYRTKKKRSNKSAKLDKYELKYIDFIHYYIEYFNQFVTINHHDILPIMYNISQKYKSLMTYKKRMSSMENLASEVRKKLNIKNNKKMMYILEQYGVYILEKELSSEKDAYSIWVEDTPYIVLSRRGQSEARRTFSLAHELGHLLMHHDIDISKLTIDEYNKLEDEANQFASCLLLPEKEIKKEFETINNPSDPNSYLYLKEKYHVSITAIEYRCYKLGLLGTSQNNHFYMLLNKNKYRFNEPLDNKWALTVPGKIIYMIKFILDHCISQDKILASNGIRSEFLNNLFCLREPLFSDKYSSSKVIKINCEKKPVDISDYLQY